MLDVTKPLEAGACFQERYEIVRCIASGGMGAVYEVVHLETRRRRALKVMLPSVVTDSELRARFRLEATITADIETEHIVETFDAGVDMETGAPFLVMELLKGEDLNEMIARLGRVPAEECVTLLRQAAIALDKTHAASIVHRDLKPENLFVTRRDDGSPRLKLLDFGIAKIVAQSPVANATRSMGSPLYMAPEQAKGDGKIGLRADLYALAHIAYTTLVGKAYWTEDAESLEGIWGLLILLMAGAKEPPSARAARAGATLPPAFDAWFFKATAIDPADRFERASEQVEALAEVLGVAPARPAAVLAVPAPAAISTPTATPAAGPTPAPAPTAEGAAKVVTDAARPPSAAATTGPADGGTLSAIGDPVPGEARRPATPIVIAAAVIAVGVGAAALLRGGREPAPGVAPVAASPAATAADRPAPSASAPVVDVAPAATASTAPLASASASAPAPAAAAPAPKPQGASPPPRPAAATATAKATPPPARPPHDDGI